MHNQQVTQSSAIPPPAPPRRYAAMSMPTFDFRPRIPSTINALDGKLKILSKHPFCASNKLQLSFTLFSFIYILIDSVILIGDDPLPRPIPILLPDPNNSQDVIFVSEHRPQDRQHVLASVDVSSSNVSEDQVQAVCEQTNIQNVTARPEPVMNPSQPRPSTNQLQSSNVSELGSIVNCPICFNDVPNNDIHSTVCGHLFCGKCIKTAIGVHKKCPLCNKPLNLQQIHRIFFNQH